MNDSFKPGDPVLFETSGGLMEGWIVQNDTDDFGKPVSRIRAVHDDRVWAGNPIERAWWLKKPEPIVSA